MGAGSWWGRCHSPSEVGEPGTGGTLTVTCSLRTSGAGHSRAGEPLTPTPRIHTLPDRREGAAVPPWAAPARGTRAGNFLGWAEGSKLGARKGLFGIFQSSLL